MTICLVPLSAGIGLADSSGADAAPPATPPAPTCDADDVVVHDPDPAPGSEPACAATARTAQEIADARAYLSETASPGYTMTRQGMELAIGRLHPEFVVRLAGAIRQARNGGLPLAGVSSAYRPPAFGIGGFSDKFNSLHTYGLAVDMHGIGRPGSAEAQHWHEVAAKNGVVCPYGPRNRAEWNHCQPTRLKVVVAQNPLRETVSAEGPFDLASMFEAGDALIASMASAADSLSRPAPASVRAVTVAARAGRSTKRHARAALRRAHVKTARHAKAGVRVSLGKAPIIAVEERRRKAKSGRG